jgi:hypothetical protein
MPVETGRASLRPQQQVAAINFQIYRYEQWLRTFLNCPIYSNAYSGIEAVPTFGQLPARFLDRQQNKSFEPERLK